MLKLELILKILALKENSQRSNYELSEMEITKSLLCLRNQTNRINNPSNPLSLTKLHSYNVSNSFNSSEDVFGSKNILSKDLARLNETTNGSYTMRSYIKDTKTTIDQIADISILQICAEQVAVRLDQHSHHKLNYNRHNILNIITERIKGSNNSYIEELMKEAKAKLKKFFNKEIWKIIKELELHRINTKINQESTIHNSYEQRQCCSNERINDESNFSSNIKNINSLMNEQNKLTNHKSFSSMCCTSLNSILVGNNLSRPESSCNKNQHPNSCIRKSLNETKPTRKPSCNNSLSGSMNTIVKIPKKCKNKSFSNKSSQQSQNNSLSRKAYINKNKK